MFSLQIRPNKRDPHPRCQGQNFTSEERAVSTSRLCSYNEFGLNPEGSFFYVGMRTKRPYVPGSMSECLNFSTGSCVIVVAGLVRRT